MKEPEKGTQVKSLVKAMDILCLLSDSPDGMTLTEIAEAMRMPKTTVYGIVSTMLDHSFVDRYSKTGRYRVGLKIFELGHSVTKNLEVLTTAYPYMQELLKRYDSLVHLVYFDHDEVLYLKKLETINAPRVSTSSGGRFYMHATGVGKAMMANLPEYKVDRIIAKFGLPKLTPYTITAEGVLKAQLKKIARQGYAEDVREGFEDVYCVAAPIFNHEGNAYYAISICSYIDRVTPEKRESMIADVVRSAQIISYEVGYRTVSDKRHKNESERDYP